MNLGGLQKALKKAVSRKDLEYAYKDSINRALRTTQQSYPWTCMEHVQEVTMTSGSEFVSMPPDFKELQRGRAPIGLVPATGSGYLPLNLMLGPQLRRLANRQNYHSTGSRSSVWNPARPQAGMSAWMERQSGKTVLRLPGPVGEDVTFRVYYYRYLPALEKTTDENYFTIHFPEMILNKAKAELFELINDDERAVMAEKLFDKQRAEAQHSDALTEMAGTRVQM